jgi:peptide-methionine (S)-S-oxide reductase
MLKHAMFGAGCFWGVEATFRKVPGVTDVAVGYSGGQTENPSYQEVCSDETGHAEVVWIEYDPEKVNYAELLDVFFTHHNPTTLNRQGPDAGTQYRSVIFYYDDEQKAQALAAKADNAKKWPRPIVTKIEAAQPFYRAEEYHQRYLEKHGRDHCAS